MKIVLLSLLAIFGLLLVVATVVGNRELKHIEGLPTVLQSSAGGTVLVAADKQHFRLIAEIGSLYEYTHSRPTSREDQRELNASQQMAQYVRDTIAEVKAKKAGLVVEIPVNTRCEEIQRVEFPETRFSQPVVRVQIRVLGGPHQGFEGWVFKGQTGHAEIPALQPR